MRAWIVQGISVDVRADGRNRIGFRPSTVECGVLVNTSGSAHVCRGGTEAVAGVKLEVGPLFNGGGELAVHVDWPASETTTFSSAEDRDRLFWLSNALTKSLTSVDRKALVVSTEAQLAWHVHVDCVVLNSDGSLLDVLSVAVRAALLDTRIPRLHLSRTLVNTVELAAAEGADDESSWLPFDASHVPVFVSLALVGGNFIVDATATEEEHCSAQLFVACTSEGVITFSHQSGEDGLSAGQLWSMLNVAKDGAVSVIRAVNVRVDAASKEETEDKVFVKLT